MCLVHKVSATAEVQRRPGQQRRNGMQEGTAKATHSKKCGFPKFRVPQLLCRSTACTVSTQALGGKRTSANMKPARFAVSNQVLVSDPQVAGLQPQNIKLEQAYLLA